MAIIIKGQNDFHEGWVAGIISPLLDPPVGRSSGAWLEGWATAKESAPQTASQVALDDPEALQSLGRLLLGLREAIYRGDKVHFSVTNVEAW